MLMNALVSICTTISALVCIVKCNLTKDTCVCGVGLNDILKCNVCVQPEHGHTPKPWEIEKNANGMQIEFEYDKNGVALE